MKKFTLFAGILALMVFSTSCLKDKDDYVDVRPTGLVTVYPQEDGSFYMQLDDKTVLYPTNVKSSPYKDKVVRALVNYTEDNSSREPRIESADEIIKRNVKVNWMDSIRTKEPVLTKGAEDALVYGNDPIEIMRDWVTVAEDGFLTLRVRARWGMSGKKHNINLVSGVNPENPFEFELRHDENGDYGVELADALVAFNLNYLRNDLSNSEEEVKIKLRWKSFSGDKSTEFDLKMHKEI